MRRDRLGKLYDRFDPEERFRLTLEALARGDEREAKRLSESCPLRTYMIKDLAYCDRLRASRQITTIAYWGSCPDPRPAPNNRGAPGDAALPSQEVAGRGGLRVLRGVPRG